MSEDTSSGAAREPKAASDRPLSRRQLLTGAAGVAGAALVGGLVDPGVGQVPAPPPPAPLPDPTRVQGPGPSPLGARSAYESIRRNPGPVTSSTPHQDLHGMLTPSDLHFERHHAGIPTIDPESYSLLVHGLVERPMVFTLEDLKRLPSVSMIRFLECSGNFGRNAPETARPQEICPLTSQSEWTGVPLSVLFREVGALPQATWFLAEGMDASVMTRSVPVAKGLDDAIIAYGQNGEALRPANGYPARLFLPGWEGNASVKWIRRIELSDGPFMTREETSKYTDPLKGERARQFSFVMDARSLITYPAHPKRIEPGWTEIRGFAWSGRGRVAKVELSFDEGRSWTETDLQDPVLPMAHTRFRFLWRWNGREATILSRATDETGYVQPTLRELIDARGVGTAYHMNPITGWRVLPDGSVMFRTEAWV
jgi:sulfane dehydrogenase subunit SoxC